MYMIVLKLGQSMEYQILLNVNYFWSIAKWLRHWFLISACKGSNPFVPNFSLNLMTKYYKKLISRTTLLNFWVFSGNDIKTVFQKNFKLLNLVYNQKAILDFDSLILGIKKVLPIFKYLCGTGINILFVSSNYIYTQTVHADNSCNLGKQLSEWKVGILSNFSLQGFRLFKHLQLSSPPSAMVFLNFQENDLLLLESKKKNLPSIGLVDDNFNSYLMDYPICLSPLYFYNVYFFSKFFFRYLTLSI